MSHLRDLVEAYTTVWNERDVERFSTMVADGCIRHDPGSTRAIPLAENVARFVGTHEQLPGVRITNAAMFEHGDDTITVCYTFAHAAGELAGIEVFRFENDRIVEVWNVPPGDGPWPAAARR
jgi:predicted SnoaL-like aldol condensation-catalyzing enzyme